MIPTAILNAILAVSVIVMVVTPLVWAIVTQQRDHPGPATTDVPTIDVSHSRERRHAAHPQYKPLGGRI